MILRALYELYDRLASDADYGIAPAGFSYQRISFVVVINEDGSLHAVEDARSSIEGRLQTRRVLVPGGAKKTGSGLNPCFLWDNRVYVGTGTSVSNAQSTCPSFLQCADSSNGGIRLRRAAIPFSMK
jgi:hypothetical protein